MAEGTMTTFLTTIGEFFTSSLGWAVDIYAEVIKEPALLILCVGIPIVGFVYGLIRRIVSL